MGGFGSGRRFQFGADTTEDYRTLDVRTLYRQGITAANVRSQITWSKGERVTAAIAVEAKPGRIVLDYRHRDRGGEWHPMRYSILLTTTDCHLGGSRYWFQCPADGCGRRVAILYGGAIFVCRHCLQLTYASRRERPWDRATRRAHRIRKKLEWPGCILDGSYDTKPKGMHWSTYERLCAEHDALADFAIGGIESYLDSRC